MQILRLTKPEPEPPLHPGKRLHHAKALDRPGEDGFFFISIFALQVEKIYNSSGKVPTYIKEIATTAKRERHTDSLMKIEGAGVS